MRPLEGVRILDFTHVLAGPFATRVLADMGADVVKINTSQRATGINPPESPYFTLWNRNKRTIALNMNTNEAQSVALELAKKADVVIDNFSLGVLSRWGIDLETVQPHNPKVVFVQMSGMGAGGPWSDFVTFAPTIHALSGLTFLSGVPGRTDIGIGFSYNDHQAGLHAAMAVLAGLEGVRETGKGQQVDMSQFEVAVSMIGPALLDYFANGIVAQPTGNQLPYDKIAPHGTYQCRPASGSASDILDESWIAIVCRDESEWQQLKKIMGNPTWGESEAFANIEERYSNSEALDQYINSWTSEKNARELMIELQSAGVPAGVVQNGMDLVENDEQLPHRHFLQMSNEPHPAIGPIFFDRLPLYFEKTPCDIYERSRLIGEDNAAALNDWLGMSASDVKEGEEKGYLA